MLQTETGSASVLFTSCEMIQRIQTTLLVSPIPVHTTTHNQRFQKSPLWPEFLEIIVFCDKNRVFV